MPAYRSLKVYILAAELNSVIYELTKSFPSSERFSLTDQFRRSVHSIVANIAEGYGRRYYPPEYARFLIFSQASCDESREHLKAAYERRYFDKEQFDNIDDKFDHIGRMLTLLIRKIRNSIRETSKRGTK